jgi:hypothetical protein
MDNHSKVLEGVCGRNHLGDESIIFCGGFSVREVFMAKSVLWNDFAE